VAAASEHIIIAAWQRYLTVIARHFNASFEIGAIRATTRILDDLNSVWF